jgi:Flp pilus assembly pilin Flp
MRALHQFWLDEEAQDLIEYSLILAFFALFAAAFMGNAQDVINSIWNRNMDNLRSANAVAG